MDYGGIDVVNIYDGGVESTSRVSRHEASTVICVCLGYYLSLQALLFKVGHSCVAISKPN